MRAALAALLALLGFTFILAFVTALSQNYILFAFFTFFTYLGPCLLSLVILVLSQCCILRKLVQLKSKSFAMRIYFLPFSRLSPTWFLVFYAHHPPYYSDHDPLCISLSFLNKCF